MATRFYLPSTGAADVSPSYDASWEGTDEAAGRKCVTTPGSTAMTSVTAAETSTSGSHDELIRQYVSDPIDAQTISGTIKGQIRAEQSVLAADMRAQMVVRVVSNDGSTVRGTLLASNTTSLANEFSSTALENRKFPKGWAGSGTAISSVAASAGDRIVIELGYRAHNTSSLSRSGTLRFGDTAASDLAENETATTDNRPWVEFSADITFQGSTQSITASGLASTAAFGGATVTRGAVSVSATGIGSTAAIGSAAVTARNAITTTGLAPTAAFGSAAVTPGGVSVSATGIASVAAFGGATVSQDGGAQTIDSVGIASTAAFGDTTVTTTSAVTAQGISGTAAFGSAEVSASGSIAVSGIESTVAFGSALVAATSEIAAIGIASGAAFGSAGVTASAGITVTGITSTAAFGQAGVASVVSVTPEGITPAEAFGSPGVSASAGIGATGIPPGSAAGIPAVVPPAQQITAEGAASTVAAGMPQVISLVASGLNVLRVPAESRVTTPATETRLVSIANDNRVAFAQAESRVTSIATETRIVRVAA